MLGRYRQQVNHAGGMLRIEGILLHPWPRAVRRCASSRANGGRRFAATPL